MYYISKELDDPYAQYTCLWGDEFLAIVSISRDVMTCYALM